MTDDPKGDRLAAARARSGALLRKLDGERPVTAADLIHHAPNCQRLVIIVTKGYSVTVNRCDQCGALSTVRHGAP